MMQLQHRMFPGTPPSLCLIGHTHLLPPLIQLSHPTHVSLLQLADCSWDQTIKLYHPPSITPKPEP